MLARHTHQPACWHDTPTFQSEPGIVRCVHIGSLCVLSQQLHWACQPQPPGGG